MKKIKNNTELKMPEENFGVSFVEKDHSAIGVIIAVLVTLLVMLLGLLYVWGTFLKKDLATPPQVEVTRPTAEENNEPESTNAEAEVETMSALSTSDELSAIKADIDSSAIDSLDAENTAIDELLR